MWQWARDHRSRNGFGGGLGDPAYRRLDTRLLTDRHKSIAEPAPPGLIAFSLRRHHRCPSDRVLFFHDGCISQRHPLPHFSIKTPAPALGFRNSSATGLRFWTRRQSTVETAARFTELDSDPTSPARSGLGNSAQGRERRYRRDDLDVMHHPRCPTSPPRNASGAPA